MPPRRPNQKAVAAKEKNAANQAVKDAAEARKREAAEAAEWNKGSNVRGAAKAENAAQKADEAARKRREKAALLAAEEDDVGSGKPKKAQGSGAKKGKGKKKDALSLLEDSLVGDADKKAKASKKKERERKEREERMRQERERRDAEAKRNEDPMMAATESMIGSVDDGAAVGRAANVENADAIMGSGIDKALGAMAVSGDAAEDRHPEKRVKALHRAFEERMMPQMKEDFPGLKQSQYRDKIFQLWKKSPENPLNQQRGEK